MKKKRILQIMEYPYVCLLLLSGICMYLYCGVNHIRNLVYTQSISGHIMGTAVISSEETDILEEQKDKEDFAGTEESFGLQEQEDKEVLAGVEESFGLREQEQSGSQEEPIVGVTEFVNYEPKIITSPYYTDPGKIALTTNYPYETVDDSYFSDAAFIGDSRTLGLYDYSGLPDTDFYCDNGFCTYLWSKGKKVMHQNVGQEVLLDEAITQKKYGKIYLMVGLNDCGYGTVEDFKGRYGEMLAMLHDKQPEAVIYLLANLHLSKVKSDADAVYNNVDINAHNVAIAEWADGINTFYLDSGGLFLDEQRNLKPELTFDGTHLYADGYQLWMDYFRQHAVINQ